MNRVVRNSKALFQYTKTVLPEAWAALFYRYDEEVELAKVRLKLRQRISASCEKPINFIMAVPIVNWEVTLMEHASQFGTCHHISFEGRGFFKNRDEWYEYRKQNQSRLLDGFSKAYQPDNVNILFLYLSEFHIDPEIINHFKIKNTIVVLFNWDDRLHYQSHHKGQSVGIRKLVNRVDFCLSMAVSPLPRYIADGGSVFYWHGLVNLNFGQNEIKLPEVEFERVLFFGSKYGYREELINFLLKKNVPIDIYGNGWGSEFVPYDELAYKIPRYAVNLGVSAIGYTSKLSCVKGRDIEVPSLGGLYLTNTNREIAQLFIENTDILTYRNKNDCICRINQVLENPIMFAEIRSNAFKKSAAYSWRSKFSYLYKVIKDVSKNES